MTGRFERAAYGVAVNPSAPSSVLLRLLAEHDPYLRRAIMGRENLPRDVADVIVAHPDTRVRMDFAESWRAALIERLSRDPAPSVRCAAARDPRLSLARVRELLAEPETASAAAMNRVLPVEDMHAVLDGAGIPA